MSRYRSYGKAPGARNYLSSREEFTMSEAEKNEAFERRKKAAEAAEREKAFVPTTLATPIWPSPKSIMRWEAHGTPIPPPPEGYTGPIPDRYAAHIAWPAPVSMQIDEEECEEGEEAHAPGM